MAIGVAGVLALVFAVLVLYQMVANEDAANAPPPQDADAPQEMFPGTKPANGSSEAAGSDKEKKASEPDKPPPLNEK